GEDRSATVTLLGQSLSLDAEALWGQLCRWALTAGDWRAGTEELVWLQLLREPSTRADPGTSTIALARDEGHLLGQNLATGALEQVDDGTASQWVSGVVDEALQLAAALRLLRSDRIRRKPVELTDAGWWTVTAMIRGRAVGPAHTLLPL